MNFPKEFAIIKATDKLYETGAFAFQESQGKSQICHECGFPVFAWYKNKRLFDDALIGTVMPKNQDPVAYEFFPGLEPHWFAPQRSAIECLTLAMYHG